MARHVMVALTNAKDGSDQAFNDAYEGHLKELLAVPGFVAAQRLRLDPVQPPARTPYRYLTLYEIETDDLAATLAALGSRTSTIDMGQVMDPDAIVNLFTPMGERLVRVD